MVAISNSTPSILPANLENVGVQKRGRTILSKITLELESGGITILMGPNGSGKTTLLRAIHGLERLSTGTITWGDQQTIAQDRQAFVFQRPTMLRRNVIDNIAYPLLVKKVDKSEALDRAASWAKKINLENKLTLEASVLSGGERQKLALARALIAEPELLFLDEPTTNLDGLSTRQIETLLIDAHAAGTQIIMATHDLGQAKRLADKVIFLHKGRICETASAKAFFKHPVSDEAHAYINGEIVE